MKLHSRFVFIGFFLVALILVEVSIYFLLIRTQTADPVKLKNGVLDLSGWNFQTDGPLKLDGEWEFYWKTFLRPVDFTEQNVLTRELIQVPGLWNKHPAIQGLEPGKGFATYRLKITNLAKTGLYAIKIPDINTSYELWIDNQLIASNGFVSDNPIQAIPQYLPKVAVFALENNHLNITVNVSNFQYSLGGVWKSLILGTESQISQKRENRKAFELFLVGTLLVMGIYHLGLYFLGKKEYAMLYFGLFCLLIMGRTLMTGERLFIEAFPGFNWQWALKMELIPVFWGPVIFLLFLQSLYPVEVNKRVLTVTLITEIVGSMTLFLLSPDSFEPIFVTFQVILILVSTYCFFVLMLAFKRNRIGADFLVAGYIVLFFSIINDVMYSQFIIESDYIVPFGLIFFVLFAFALQKKFVQAEIALKISEEKNKALLKALPDSMFQLDKKGVVIDYKSSKTSGVYSFQQNIDGKCLEDLFPKNIADDFNGLLNRVIVSGQNQVIEQCFTSNGQTIYFEIRAVKSDDDKVIAIIRDVSEKKHAENKAEKHRRQLVQADKMVALGTLVAGVAHEINNPNNAILLTSQVLAENWNTLVPVLDEYVEENGDIDIGGRMYSEWREIMPDDFSRIIRNSERIKHIVSDLKTYSKKETGNLTENVDINEVVKSAVKVIKNKIDFYTSNFFIQYGENLPNVKGSFHQMEQVIINLTLNACQALDDSGKSVSIVTAYNDDFKKVTIHVCDQGIGMDQDTLKYICDPFFTTKKGTSGIGLGLSITARIVKEHNGILEFNSEPDQGTTVELSFDVAF